MNSLASGTLSDDPCPSPLMFGCLRFIKNGDFACIRVLSIVIDKLGHC